MPLSDPSARDSVASAVVSASSPSVLDHLKPYFDVLAAAANLATLLASVLAIYIFVANRKKLTAALQLLLNFAFQSTLSELSGKMERLNDCNCNDDAGLAEARAIFSDIAGQLRGNRRLSKPLGDIMAKIEMAARSKRITEPHKRSLVSELRETLRHHQVFSVEESDRS